MKTPPLTAAHGRIPLNCYIYKSVSEYPSLSHSLRRPLLQFSSSSSSSFDHRSGRNFHGDLFPNTTIRHRCIACLTVPCPLRARARGGEMILYLPDKNDQQTGDAFPLVSKGEVLVPHRPSQALHGLSSRCFAANST